MFPAALYRFFAGSSVSLPENFKRPEKKLKKTVKTPKKGLTRSGGHANI